MNSELFFEIFFSKKWRPYLWIILIGTLLYGQTLFFGLTFLDDQNYILEQYRYNRNFSNIPEVFRWTSFVYYRPLFKLSFFVDAFLAGRTLFIYHLSNLIYHLLACCSLYAFLKKLRYSKEASFLMTLLFTVHPVLTQAVAWIPGRSDSILTIFILQSFIALVNYVDTRKWKYYLGHICFLILALLMKETAFVFPLICLLYFWLVDKRKQALPQRIYVLSGFLFLGIWLAFRVSQFKPFLEQVIYYAKTILLPNLSGIIVYFGKANLPFNLSVLPILEDSTLAYGIISIVLFGAMLFKSKHKRWKIVLFGSIWFILFLLPSLLVGHIQYENRIYLSLIGWVIVILEIDWVKQIDLDRKKPLLVFTSIFCLFFVISFLYSFQFKDRMNFWRGAVNTSPHSPLAHRNLGAMYYLDGLLNLAEKECRKALELNPNEPMALPTPNAPPEGHQG